MDEKQKEGLNSSGSSVGKRNVVAFSVKGSTNVNIHKKWRLASFFLSYYSEVVLTVVVHNPTLFV